MSGVIQIPTIILTDNAGRNQRLRVDVGQTSFFAGREFRSFKEFSISTGQTYLVKIVTAVNVVFHTASFTLDASSLRVSTYAGGTASGTFSETLPIIAKNDMTETPAYTQTTALTAVPENGGGSITGGILRDVVRMVSGGGRSSTIDAIGAGDDAERGIKPGTYYLYFQNIGNATATGTFHCHWEERP